MVCKTIAISVKQLILAGSNIGFILSANVVVENARNQTSEGLKLLSQTVTKGLKEAKEGTNVMETACKSIDAAIDSLNRESPPAPGELTFYFSKWNEECQQFSMEISHFLINSGSSFLGTAGLIDSLSKRSLNLGSTMKDILSKLSSPTARSGLLQAQIQLLEETKQICYYGSQADPNRNQEARLRLTQSSQKVADFISQCLNILRSEFQFSNKSGEHHTNEGLLELEHCTDQIETASKSLSKPLPKPQKRAEGSYRKEDPTAQRNRKLIEQSKEVTDATSRLLYCAIVCEKDRVQSSLISSSLTFYFYRKSKSKKETQIQYLTLALLTA